MSSNPFTVRYNKSSRQQFGEAYHQKREADIQAKLKEEKLAKERAYAAALDLASYPELSSSHHKSSVVAPPGETTYVEQAKKEKPILVHETVDPATIIPDGWTLLRKDICLKKRPSDYPPASHVIDALVRLHETRTNAFIDDFGYDIWEQTFKYPRWEQDALYWEEAEESEEEDSDMDEDGDECLE